MAWITHYLAKKLSEPRISLELRRGRPLLCCPFAALQSLRKSALCVKLSLVADHVPCPIFSASL
jgi:hypothetical protein